MLTHEEVKKIAKLAKFELSEKELENFGKLLSEALDYVRILDDLDTNTVKPTAHVSGLTNVLSEDEAKKSLTIEEALQNAPKKKKGNFVTAAVLNKHKQ